MFYPVYAETDSVLGTLKIAAVQGAYAAVCERAKPLEDLRSDPHGFETLSQRFQEGPLTTFIVARKPDGSTITSGDLAPQAAIKRVTDAHLPGRDFIGEENVNAEADLARWKEGGRKKPAVLCDPVDGTGNFVKSKSDAPARWAVLLAHTAQGKTTHSAVYVSDAKDSPAGLHGKVYLADDKGVARRFSVMTKPHPQGMLEPYQIVFKDAKSLDATRRRDVASNTSVRFGQFFARPEEHGEKYSAAAFRSITQRDSLEESEKVTCAGADMMRLTDTAEKGGISMYAHGYHMPWDTAAPVHILSTIGLPVVERATGGYASAVVAGVDAEAAKAMDQRMTEYYGEQSVPVIASANVGGPEKGWRK